MLLMLSFLKSSYWSKLITANTLRSGKNDRHFGGDIFKYIFMNDKIWTFFAEVCCTLGSASVRNGSGLHMRRPITWINADRDMWRQYGVNKLQWMLATKWGREGWSRPPTPGVQPRYPHLIFPPYPRPPFSLIFWGTPAQYSDFLAPVPRPSDPRPAPFFGKSPLGNDFHVHICPIHYLSHDRPLNLTAFMWLSPILIVLLFEK